MNAIQFELHENANYVLRVHICVLCFEDLIDRYFSICLHRISTVNRMLRCLTSFRETTQRILATSPGATNWRRCVRYILDVQIRANNA